MSQHTSLASLRCHSARTLTKLCQVHTRDISQDRAAQRKDIATERLTLSANNVLDRDELGLPNICKAHV